MKNFIIHQVRNKHSSSITELLILRKDFRPAQHLNKKQKTKQSYNSPNTVRTIVYANFDRI